MLRKLMLLDGLGVPCEGSFKIAVTGAVFLIAQHR